MQNAMVMFIASVLDWKYPYGDVNYLEFDLIFILFFFRLKIFFLS